MLRVALSRPVTFLLFLALSFWPASLLAGVVPFDLAPLEVVPFDSESLAVVIAVALAASLASAHVRTSGRFRDAGAYFFWVYACLVTFGIGLVIVVGVARRASVTVAVPDPFGEAAFVLVVYATAWWLVYEDGWARVRPLNWGSDERGGPGEG